MDWGGLIAGAMGGGAKAVGEMADDQMKRNDLALAAQRAEQVAIKGEERRAALIRENAAYEMDLKLKREDEQGKRYMAQTDQITDRAKQIGSNRDIETAKPLAPSMDQPALDAVRANLSPEDQEKFYGIKQQRSSGLIGDQITAAREIGADKPVRDDLKTSYTAQVASEALTRKEDRADRDATRKEAKDDESARAALVREAEASRRTDALFAKISNGGSGGNTKAPAGYRWAKDGNLEFIPNGPADPNTKTAGNATTEGERKAATLLQRLEGSKLQLEAAATAAPSAVKPELTSSAIRSMGMENLANTATSEKRQQIEAAQLDMLDAALTLGTGAAYTREQLDGYRKSYFPQIGDEPATVADKGVRLQNIVKAARIASGRASASVAPVNGPANAAPTNAGRNNQPPAKTGGVLTYDPSTGNFH